MILNKKVGQLRAHATQTHHSATADKKQYLHVIAGLLQQIKRDSLLDIRVLQILRLINNHQIFFETQESISFLGKKLLVLACSFLDVYVKQKRLNFSMFTAAMTKLREVGDVVKTSSLGRKATVLGVDPCNMKLKLKLKFTEIGVEW